HARRPAAEAARRRLRRIRRRHGSRLPGGAARRARRRRDRARGGRHLHPPARGRPGLGRRGLPLRTAGALKLPRPPPAPPAIVLAGMAIWAFAPVLVFMALLTLALGGLAAAMILLARRLRAWRGSKKRQ